MPNYSYKCKDCGNVFDVSHGMNEKPDLTCGECEGSAVSKLISGGTGFILKGSGFYTTDYKRKEEKKKEQAPPACSAAKTCANNACPAAGE